MGKPISYELALKKGNKKEGLLTGYGLGYLTEVKWERELEVPRPLKLRTLGEVLIIQPPQLPKGYKMERHPSWDALALELYDPHEEYSNEYLFKLEKDLRDLKDLLGQDVQPGDLEDYLGPRYESYANWLERVSVKWYDLQKDIQELFCKATGFPTSGWEIELPEAAPPDLKSTLELMLKRLDE